MAIIKIYIYIPVYNNNYVHRKYYIALSVSTLSTREL